MGYDAVRIEELEGREAVRKRPGMWVGSTGERGLHELVFQVVGWAVNHVLVEAAATAPSMSRSPPMAACGSPTTGLGVPSPPRGTPAAAVSKPC